MKTIEGPDGQVIHVFEPANGNGYTKSTMEFGRQTHSKYFQGEVGKEFRLPSGKRIDYLDLKNNSIRELKPYNPRAIQQGVGQLMKYQNELNTITRFQGIDWKLFLDTY